MKLNTFGRDSQWTEVWKQNSYKRSFPVFPLHTSCLNQINIKEEMNFIHFYHAIALNSITVSDPSTEVKCFLQITSGRSS